MIEITVGGWTGQARASDGSHKSGKPVDGVHQVARGVTRLLEQIVFVQIGNIQGDFFTGTPPKSSKYRKDNLG